MTQVSTPWRADHGRIFTADGTCVVPQTYAGVPADTPYTPGLLRQAYRNADFIAEAVNRHAAMEEALRALLYEAEHVNTVTDPARFVCFVCHRPSTNTGRKADSDHAVDHEPWCKVGKARAVLSDPEPGPRTDDEVLEAAEAQLCQQALPGPCQTCGLDEDAEIHVALFGMTGKRLEPDHPFEPPRCLHPESRHGSEQVDYGAADWWCSDCKASGTSGWTHPFRVAPDPVGTEGAR